MITDFVLDACDSIALGTSFSLKLAGSVMLNEVFPQKLLIAAIVLTNKFHKAALLPVLLQVLVLDFFLAAETGILTLDSELGEGLLQHRVRIMARKRLCATMRTGDLSLILAEIDILLGAKPAEPLMATATLDWHLENIVTDPALEQALLVIFNLLNKLVFLDRLLTGQSHQWFIFTL